ncbi:sulfuric ester hydrolase [Aureococcus anophagefferens]|nr:sulfuric ester hydrolase [Aureococcus anophagefferens]
MNDLWQSSDLPVPENIATLVAEGVELTAYYGQSIVPLGHVLMPEALKRNGYGTHGIGKWNIGHCNEAYLPWMRGFDTFVGYLTDGIGYTDHVADGPSSYLYDNDALDLYDFVSHERGVTKNGDAPLFLWLAHHGVHDNAGVADAATCVDGDDGDDAAIFALAASMTRPRFRFGCALKAVDRGVGAVRRALDDRAREYVLVVHSDNGGNTCGTHCNGNNYPRRGAKFFEFEGGLRVPGVVYSPTLIPARRRGAAYAGLMHHVDWLATFVALGGGDAADLDPSYDSVDHWAHIAGRVSGAPRDTIVFAASGDTATIRSGNYKLIHHALNATYFHTWFNGTANSYPWKCNSNEMVSLFYDVVADPHERDDLTYDPAYAEKRGAHGHLARRENEYWDRPIRYDVLPAGRTFRYWDNNSVLAAEALARPVATTTRTASATTPAAGRSAASRAGAAARSGGDSGAAARYGGDAAAISVHLAADIDRAAWKHAAFLWLQEPGGTPRAPGLWAGGPSSASFPHFDLFSNLYTVLAGSKEVVLAPPSTAAPGFRVHPATHPRARQARVDGFASGAVPATLRATLRAGDAVFIPSGWIHRFTVGADGAAVATTANPPEFKYFDAWVRDSRRTTPYATAETKDFVASTRAFAGALVVELLGPDGAAALWREFLEAYAPETRAEVGLPPRRSRPVPPCPEAGADDAARQRRRRAAAEFRRAFRPELLRLYLPLFVGNLLTKISRQRAMANLFADVLDFVAACLLEDEDVGRERRWRL